MAKSTGENTSSHDKYQLNEEQPEKLKQRDALQGGVLPMNW